jgi:3,4-dihydroxy 2-butanone 4-phosphate synthase/GTP cyclohydrolase II
MKERHPMEHISSEEIVNIVEALRVQEWTRPWVFEENMKRLLEKENKKLIQELGRSPLPTEKGDWTYFVYGDMTRGVQHQVLAYGDYSIEKNVRPKENVLTRIHSSCHTNEVFGAVNCECRAQLHEAMKLMQKEGDGIILYLDQEGRGNGIAAKLAQLNGMFGWENGRIVQKRDEFGVRIDTDRAYREAGYPSESRDFAVAGQILQSMGIKSVRLLTNNPRKIRGIAQMSISVTPVEIHITPENEIIATDLQSKAQNLNHNIKEEYWQIKNK